ncbi:fimbrial protein [Pseudomonas rhizosphaerae]|uniref:fimbrial protein n=1 Tax=Pseudomonas rhizosphaerae TaxID=216142 RepID=UPI00130DE126|nr:fimbrial protein [Pseudomonas rhizosphaerae]
MKPEQPMPNPHWAACLSALIASMGWLPAALAHCTASDQRLTFASPIVMQRDMPIGAVVATGIVNTSVTCNAAGLSPRDHSWQVFPSPLNRDYGPTSIAAVRATPVAGLGIRWVNITSHTGTTATWTRQPLNAWPGGRGVPSVGTVQLHDTFQLIKTGPVASGQFPAWTFLYNYKTPVSTAVNAPLNQIAIRAPLPITVIACAVTQPNIPVSLGHVRIERFTGPASTSPDVPFSIPLDCDANARVNVQIDGTPSGAQGVLALDRISGSATGIGVQVLHKGVPVALGSRLLDGSSSTAGPYEVALVARYYKTAATVTGGPAQATATFTLTYR